MKVVKKRKEINLLNASLIYSYAIYHLNNIEQAKQANQDYCRLINLDFNHYDKHRQQVNREWLYIKNWIDLKFDITEDSKVSNV